MLLSRKQLLHPHSYTTCYCFHALVYQARSRACITAAAANTAEATSAVAAPPPKPGAPKQCARVLFVGGLPGAVDPDVLQQQLAAACSQWHPTRVEVARFEEESVRSRFAAGWQHKGHAAIAFTSEDDLAAAAAAVQQLAADDWQVAAVVGPARKPPPHWPPELTLTPQELQEVQQQQAAAALRRAHNKRQRDRRQQRLIDSVSSLLTGLSPPAGLAAAQQYQPLLGQRLQQQLLQQHQQHQQQLEQAADLQLTSSSTGGSSSVLCATDLVDQLMAAMPDPLRFAIQVDKLQQLLQTQQQQQGPGLIRLAAAPSVVAVEQQLLLDWSLLPAVVDPAFGGQLADADVVRAGAGRMNLRALRKRVQVESFMLLLLQLTLPALKANAHLHIVEFGSGSGNLVLPLAHLFPCFTLTAVDMKASAITLLRQRVQQGQMHNVRVQEGTIELYSGAADVVLALHACGAASDWSLAQAAARSAAFIVSPCCIGKVNKSNTAGLFYRQDGSKRQQADQAAAAQVQQALQQTGQIQYPRSHWLKQQMDELAAKVKAEQQQQQQQQQDASPLGTPAADPAGHTLLAQQQQQQQQQQPLSPLQQAVLQSGSRTEQCRALFSLMAQAADYSHQEDHSYPDLAALAKSNVELDRGLSMAEAGYSTALVRLLQPELTAKADVLLGLPAAGARQVTAAGSASSAFSWVWA
uniref:Methyltransferase domain-containing protein n=1 Tax=Tetradesmus obliquus TaxID=3088 RepID=A0A383V6D5_TETOB|eukprot:jgi/Sobl393_1/13728/SZX61158.1